MGKGVFGEGRASRRKLKSQVTAYLFKKSLFRPVKLPEDYHFKFSEPYQEHFLKTPDGVLLNLLSFKAATTPSKGVVLYFHGNRHNLQRWGAMHRDFTPLGFDFVALDYRGYGKSSGEPDEQRFFEDARLVYDWLCKKYAPEQIILYGRSLGSGMASALAAQVPARGLILETPFDNILGLMAAHLGRPDLTFDPPYIFPNDQHLRATKMPVLIFHGTNDSVVPYLSAHNLKQCLKPGDEFVTLEQGTHHNLNEFPLYRERLRAWLQ